jgi:hypothetical protein
MAINPKSWADTFAAELTVAGEQIPLERVIARHVEAFRELRSLGMTWRGIAALLVRAGARRADGSPISADQIRVSHARLVGDNSDIKKKAPRKRRASRLPASIEAPPLIASAPVEESPQGADHGEPPVDDDKDVSSSELENALSRLGRLTSKDANR